MRSLHLPGAAAEGIPALTSPDVTAAAKRATVRLADGRLARLVFWPVENRREPHRRHGGARLAVVTLEGGAFLSVLPSELELVEEAGE